MKHALTLTCHFVYVKHHTTHISPPLQAGKEFMGRAAVPLTRFISEEGLEDEFVLPLGKGDWTNLEGPVSNKIAA